MVQLLTTFPTKVSEEKDNMAIIVVLAVFLFFFIMSTFLLAFYLRKFKHAGAASG